MRDNNTEDIKKQQLAFLLNITYSISSCVGRAIHQPDRYCEVKARPYDAHTVAFVTEQR